MTVHMGSVIVALSVHQPDRLAGRLIRQRPTLQHHLDGLGTRQHRLEQPVRRQPLEWLS